MGICKSVPLDVQLLYGCLFKQYKAQWLWGKQRAKKMLMWPMAKYFIMEKRQRSAESKRSQMEFSRYAAATTSLKDSLEERHHTYFLKYIPMLEPDMHMEIIIIPWLRASVIKYLWCL